MSNQIISALSPLIFKVYAIKVVKPLDWGAMFVTDKTKKLL